MKLKDYLHFYEGALCRWRYVDYYPGEWSVLAALTKRDIARLCDDNSVDKIELHIRPLSDMTEDELLHVGKIFGWHHLSDESIIAQTRELMTTNFFYTKQTNIHGGTWVKVFHYLLSHHFDLFDLIDAGLAIDKTKQ